MPGSGGQGDDEAAAGREIGFEVEATAEERDHAVDVGKPHADAFVVAGEAAVGLGEGCDDARQASGRYADTGVPDGEAFLRTAKGRSGWYGARPVRAP
jgi:hypothetical protein